MLTKQRKLRKTRVRAKIEGSAKRPRLSVYRSNKKIYIQAIDDEKQVTIAQASGEAKKAGDELAKALVKKKISQAIFDRSGYKYHGKVKALAEAVREAGIKI